MSIKTIGVGDNVVDFYRHSNTIYPGGCSFNFSAYSSMLGNNSAYLGLVGNDYAARHLMAVADEMKIDTSRCHIHFGGTPCPVTLIVDGERTYPETEGSDIGGGQTLLLSQTDLDYISGFDLIHSCVYAGTEQHLEALHATGVPICMDFSTEYSDMYFRAICRNIDYAIMSCSHISVEEMLERMKKALSLGAKGVLATRGGEGSWYSEGGEIYHQEANLVKAVDTQGAGDSFLTAFFSHYIEWKKSANNTEDAASKEKAVYTALDAASAFTAKMVMLNGAFEHGVEYKEETTLF